jgi:hypothetical protein
MYVIVAPGWSVLSFSSELVAGDAWRWFCLLLINLVIDDVVIKAVVHVHVSIDRIALNVALSIANICTGQHDTMQNIINPKAKIATAQVTILRSVLDSDIFSNFMSVGSNIVISLIFAALRRTSLTF